MQESKEHAEMVMKGAVIVAVHGAFEAQTPQQDLPLAVGSRGHGVMATKKIKAKSLKLIPVCYNVRAGEHRNSFVAVVVAKDKNATFSLVRPFKDQVLVTAWHVQRASSPTRR